MRHRKKQPGEKPVRKHRPRRGRRLAVRLVLIIVAVLALAFFFTADPLFNLGFGFIRTEKTAVSRFVLDNARPVFALHTVEYSVRTVFPYDFAGPPGLLKQAIGKILKNDTLSEEEKTLAGLIKLMSEINFPLKTRKHEFVIVNARLRAGYEFALDDTLPEEEIRAKIKSFMSFDRKNGTVFFILPKPEIVDVIIEDFSAGSYEFPDISFSPDEWKKVAGFISENLKHHALVDTVLAEAEENTKALLRELFTAGGWKDVVFTGEGEIRPK
ncbi:MAG: DUF4230 domain-containing protein [Spirochaetales bacterium]|nr:DUF4230 domain-containing protein [Spirochaetales bacterium]